MPEDKRRESKVQSERSGLHKFNCVIVTGLPGSGKTTCGKLLSKRLGYQFIDSDKLIERSEGMSVRDIFSRLGEPHFRKLERQVLQLIEGRLSGVSRGNRANEADLENTVSRGNRANRMDLDRANEMDLENPVANEADMGNSKCQGNGTSGDSKSYIQTTGIEGSVTAEVLRALKTKGLVLSVGGGMPEPEENRERLKRIGTVVYLFSDPYEIASRLKEDGARPLLSQNAKSNDAKVSVSTHKSQSINSEKSSNKKITSQDVVDNNNQNDLNSTETAPDNRHQPTPDNAFAQVLQRLQELLDRRKQAYECADITIDTSGLAPHQIVNRLQEALKTHQQIL